MSWTSDYWCSFFRSDITLQENSKLVTWGMWRMGQEWQNQLCLSRMTSPNVTQTGMDFLCGAWTCLCVTNLTQTWHKRDTNLNLNFFVAHGLSLWRMDPYATHMTSQTCLWRMDSCATHTRKKFKFFPSTLPTFSLYKLHFSHIFSSPLSIFSYSLPTFFSPLPLLHYFPPLHFHSSYLISHLTNYT